MRRLKTCTVSVWTSKCFPSKSIAFIPSLLDLYCTGALELLMPNVIGFQLFPPRNMMTWFIFFNYGTIISYSHYFYYKLSYPPGLFCLIICLFLLNVYFPKSEIPRIYPRYYLCKPVKWNMLWEYHQQY